MVNTQQGIHAVLKGNAAEAQRLGKEGLAVMRDGGAPLSIARALCSLGFIACHQQDYGKAQEHYFEALKILTPTELRGFDWAVIWAGLAHAFIRQPATIACGVQLAAVIEKILKDMGAALWPIVRVQFDEALTFAKESLGEAAFQPVWETGQKFSMEEAIALAG